MLLVQNADDVRLKIKPVCLASVLAAHSFVKSLVFAVINIGTILVNFVNTAERQDNMSYKPLKIELLEIVGIESSFRAMRLPKDRQKDHVSFLENLTLARKLIKAGPDHAKAMRGILVYVELKMQAGWMVEFETYRHGVECLSTSSSMHNELKNLTGAELARQKQIDLSEKVYTRICYISYQALRAMYRARRYHRHPDWQIFCDWIETLPLFELIAPENFD